ncbi:fatty acid synthase [Trichonephila inaurata madagascariensis]|uniref:Fatty acid synthase n=1 Tax=Trichonephila inaurata madagascariensis TaxID=2747483 RepID=A0A8X6XNR3_9ARAC|nr:fatty acid synthase [Trichonephila inaurata madagascariensis]
MNTVGKSYKTSPMILVETPVRYLRICVDYRRLNAIAITMYYPLSHLENKVKYVSKANYVTELGVTKDSNQEFIFQTDVSNRGVGVVLVQMKSEGEEHPARYSSKNFTESGKRYVITEKEYARKLSFVVYISYIERKFEISEGNSIVCSGRVNVFPETERKDLAQWCKEEDVKNLPMDANDVYKELKLRGYEYGPNFQLIIGADIEGNKGLLKWTGEWITFLDSVLQFSLLHAQERALCLPTRIQKLSIDPLFHMKVIEKSQKGKH